LRKRRIDRDVLDPAPVDEDGAPVAQRCDVTATRLEHGYPVHYRSQCVITAAIKNERIFFVSRCRETQYPAQEDHVIAAIMLRVWFAFEMGENAGEDGASP